MSLPEIAGHELQDLIGSGSCGAVYTARTSQGKMRAVKVLSSMAINRKALSTACQVLRSMPPHPGLLPVEDCCFDRSPYYVATPLVGEIGKDSQGRQTWHSTSLEEAFQQNRSTEEAWRIVYDLAEALAWLHKHGLPHGNLRPSNVLLEDDAECSVRITDLAQGWVGGVHHMELSNHFIYLCPDQAENPDGVFTGYGANWDVYSFGVLAYQLLTGHLPRGEAVWMEQMRHAQAQWDAGLPGQIDSLALLQGVRADPEITWPRPASSKWEERRRSIIERALDLNGSNRWVDLREVVHQFEVLEADYLLEESRQQTVHERVKQTKKVRLLTTTGLALLIALSLASIYGIFTLFRARKAEHTIGDNLATYEADVAAREDRAAQEIETRDERISTLTTERDGARAAKTVADANLQHAQTAVDRFLTQLLQTPTGNEMEVDFSRSQMQDALAFSMGNLGDLEKNPSMGVERARTYGNIGQIHLRLRDDAQARTYLEKARKEVLALIAADPDPARLPSYHQFLGRYNLLLSDLARRHGDTNTSYTLLQEAVPHLKDGLQADPDNRLARIEAARASLEFGIRSFNTGHLEEAENALAQVPIILDSTVIGEDLTSDESFLVARAEFNQGLIAKEKGELESALSTLIDAVQKMVDLVNGSSPQNQEQALKLAEAYTEIAELIGQHFNADDAKSAHQQAVAILIELNRLHPEWAEVKYLMARNDGAISQLERDAGDTSDAARHKQDAIEHVNELIADDETNRRYLFLQAKLRGEYAEMLADAGKSKEAVAMVKQAIEQTEALIAGGGGSADAPLTPEQKRWEIQLAQMYGVMGHSSQKAGQKDLAISSFTHANERWQRLSQAGQPDEIIQQGLNWSKDRLDKLK
ncbi:MAG: protein kinase [Verrucomicrobiales bacterium]|nr:protein kinase [Verrucomicrobiales bacterium]